MMISIGRYAGTETDAPSIGGAPIEIIIANSTDAQATRITAAVTKLIVDEQVAPEEIAVLIVRDPKQPGNRGKSRAR